MHYYKVTGIKDGTTWALGYTSNKWAWIKNGNGWKASELVFTRIEKEKPIKSPFYK